MFIRSTKEFNEEQESIGFNEAEAIMIKETLDNEEQLINRRKAKESLSKIN